MRALVPSARGRLVLATCFAALSLSLAFFPAGAQANTFSVDGISDQSLPMWDAGFVGSDFAGLFERSWVADSHIRYARYVVQWNVMSDAYTAERSIFEHWLQDVASMGLVADVSLTSYDHVYPKSAAEYAAALTAILDRASAIGDPVPYLEAWNEPNNQGHEPAVEAARFANAARAVCAAGHDCVMIAGDFEDAPGLARYEREYERNLDRAPAIWGVHPYWSVEEMSEAPYLNFIDNLPNGGTGVRIWFTEIAARKCTDYNGDLKEYGEAGQARRAEWLVDTLMRNHPPEHAFYYDFLLGGYRQPSCAAEREDGALYVPGGDPPRVEDRPRAAAGIIWGGAGLAAGYDGPVPAVPPPFPAKLQDSSILGLPVCIGGPGCRSS
ncbi:MAG TPA: hypothetical protein VGL57_13670 [Solirubrobacteraceae bacterium]|jgi:hypothetical protein